MATKTKPQPVTIRPYGGRYDRAMFAESENGTARKLYSIAIYDASGIICSIDNYSFSKLPDTIGNEYIKMDIPITWKAKDKPDYTEHRAHFVKYVEIGVLKYVLLIPAELVTIAPAQPLKIHRSIRECTQAYTVEGFPATFSATVFHPHPKYAMIHELEALQKDQYRIFTSDDIVTPYAKKRIAEFIAKLEEYTAEAERIATESDAEYIAECGAVGARFDFDTERGCYRPIAS